MSVDLNDYICRSPFEYTEIYKGKQTMCCPAWLDKDIMVTDNLVDNWNSELAQEIRNSVSDGSFKHCSKTNCPSLSTLINTGRESGPINRKINFTPDSNRTPKIVKFLFDNACNLACPSCRTNFIKNDNEIYVSSKSILDEITEGYGQTLEEIQLSGLGDPFYSDAFFEFLQNVNNDQFPNLQKIHLHTNGMLWNESNWQKISNAHQYIKGAEISIDAATKETYETVRRGGKWDVLERNLKFINSIETLDYLTVSFVTQKANYKEMVDFYYLMKKTFNNFSDKWDNDFKFTINFYRILDWGHLKEEYINKQIWDINHPEYNDFIKEVNRLNQVEEKEKFLVHNLW